MPVELQQVQQQGRGRFQVGGGRLIWLAEVEPVCAWLTENARGRAAAALAAALRADAAECSQRRLAPTAFRFSPPDTQARLLTAALAAVR